MQNLTTDDMRRLLLAQVAELDKIEIDKRPPDEPSGAIRDTGRQTTTGNPIYIYDPGGPSWCSNASGDLDTQSPDGKHLMLFDVRRIMHVAVELSSLKLRDVVGFGTGGGTCEFPMWRSGEPASIVYPTTTSLVSHNVESGAIRSKLDAIPYTAQWRTGIGDRHHLFIYAGPQVVMFDAVTLKESGRINLRDIGNTAERVHNPHPTKNCLILSIRPFQTRDYWVDWDGRSWGEVETPYGQYMIHQTLNTSGLCCYAWDDRLVVCDLSNPTKPNLLYTRSLRDLIGGRYSQYQHGVLADDGTLTFVGTRIGDVAGELRAHGIYRCNVLDQNGSIDRIVELDVVSNGPWNTIPRVAGRDWIAWQEATPNGYNAHFAKA